MIPMKLGYVPMKVSGHAWQQVRRSDFPTFTMKQYIWLDRIQMQVFHC